MYNRSKRHFHGNRPHYKKGQNETDNRQDAAPAGTSPETAGQDPATAGENPNTPQAAGNLQPANPSPSAQQEKPYYPFKSAQSRKAPPENAQSLLAQVNADGPPDPNAPICSICNMPVRSKYTAIHHRTTNELVHFDCALRELSRELTPKLGRNRKVYYIGAGNFAVVRELYNRRGHLKTYEIVERIAYEAKEK